MCRTIRSTVLCVLSTIWLSFSAIPSESAEWRIWTVRAKSEERDRQFQAEFVEKDEQTVVLLGRDGSVRKIPIETLSPPDRDYVSAKASQAPYALRTWTPSQGDSLMARFVGTDERSIRLELASGAAVLLPRRNLGEEDVRYVRVVEELKTQQLAAAGLWKTLPNGVGTVTLNPGEPFDGTVLAAFLMSTDGKRLFAVKHGGGTYFFDTEQARRISYSKATFPAGVICCFFLPDGQSVGRMDEYEHVIRYHEFDIASGADRDASRAEWATSFERVVDAQRGRYRAVGISPQGDMIAVVCPRRPQRAVDGKIRATVAFLATDKFAAPPLPAPFELEIPEKAAIGPPVFSADRHYLVIGPQIWNLQTGLAVTLPERFGVNTCQRAFLDNNRILAAVVSGQLLLFATDSGTLLRTVRLVRCRDVALAPQGRFIAHTCGPEIQLTDNKTGETAGTIKADKEIMNLAISCDGTRLASADSQGRFQLWNIEDIRPDVRGTGAPRFPGDFSDQ